MKIAITFDLDETARRAIASYYGVHGLADRKTCVSFITSMVRADISTAGDDDALPTGKERA